MFTTTGWMAGRRWLAVSTLCVTMIVGVGGFQGCASKADHGYLGTDIADFKMLPLARSEFQVLDENRISNGKLEFEGHHHDIGILAQWYMEEMNDLGWTLERASLHPDLKTMSFVKDARRTTVDMRRSGDDAQMVFATVEVSPQ